YDQQACHLTNPQVWDRSNGRIYKIVYGDRKAKPVDLRKMSDKELVALQLHKNDWYVRHARRILQERYSSPLAPKGGEGSGVRGLHAALDKIAFGHKDDTRRLRGLWALHVTGGLTAERLNKALADESGYVRGWALQLALENGKASPALLKKMAEMARK